jgi:hypothetical protein
MRHSAWRSDDTGLNDDAWLSDDARLDTPEQAA